MGHQLRPLRLQEGLRPRWAKEAAHAGADPPPADAVVRRIFDMVLQGKSILDVTKTLNAGGIPTTNGKRWLKTTIHTMLANEAYTGAVV